MADLKISQLTGASTPLAGTEVLPIVQSGSTVKVSVANLTAGRAVGMAGGSFTDNITQSTAAKGVNFTANTAAAGMTSQLLNWYEAGTFTPTYTSTGTPPTVTYSHQYGKYTRIGRQVFFTIEIGTNSATAGTGLLAVGGLPFAAVNDRFTGTFSVGYADAFTTAAPSGGYVFAGETIARLTYEASATSKTEMLTTFLTNGAGQNYLVISGSYIV